MIFFKRVLILLVCLGLGLGLGIGLIACDKDARQVGPMERYVTAAWFQREARRPPAEPCERPVLRGKARPGSGTAKLAALFGKGVVPGCKFAGDFDKRFHQVVLAGIRPGHTMLSEWGHQRRVSRFPRHPLSVDSRIVGVAKACRPLIKRMREAVQHASACAPYRPGWKGYADVTGRWVLISAIRYEARLKVRAGDRAGAFALLADGIRFTQDLGRGGATAVQHFWAVVNGRILAQELESLLNSHRPIPPALLTQIERELDSLIASEPAAHVWLPAALLDLVINDMLPKAMPDGWVPPGGWSYEGPDIAGGGSSDEAALGALAVRSLVGRIRQACPKGTGVVQCMSALDAVARKLAPGVSLTSEALRKRADAVESKGGDLRRTLIPYLQALYLVMHRKYHLRIVGRAFYLGALRLRLAYRRLSETARRCPDKAAFERPPLKRWRTDRVTGRGFDLQELEPGHLRIAWPKAVKYDEKWPPIVVLRCPY